MKSSVSDHRERMRQRGMVRVEVQVPKDDASLVRRIGGALADPIRAAQARLLLREHFAEHPRKGLKALLASAPLDGIDVERPRDLGRVVDL